jgi:two-component system response regulator NreC
MVDKIRILLVDDHAILRAGLRALLSAEPDIEVVSEAGNGLEAVAQTEKLSPDIVLMDITMPVMDGLEATRRIHQSCPEVKVLVLTIHDSEEYLFQILEAGGAGYLVKDSADTDLINAIHAVYRGEAFLSPLAAKMVIKRYLRAVGQEEQKQNYEDLTRREKEILKLIADGYTNQEIADLLIISVKTVETHRAHILEKLELRTRADLVKYARSQGLLD